MILDAPRSVSVLLPTYQAARYLDRVLEALAHQDFSAPWDLVVLDCGSTDGTLEILEAWRPRLGVPLAVHTLRDVAFDHGDARNRLAALSAGELLVYLTDDAIPGSADWLTRIAACFAEPRVAAVYCRNVPRPDARPFARVATLRDPTYECGSRVNSSPGPEAWRAMDSEELRALYAYCDTASALRRSIWERHPYPPTDAGEDVLLARALVDAGFAVRYESEATVFHTHEWEVDRVRRRAVVDGRFNSEAFGRTAVETRDGAAQFAAAALAQDAAALAAAAPVGEGLRGAALEAEIAHATEQRHAYFGGLLAGLKYGVRRLPTRVLDSPRVSVLLVHDVTTEAAALRLRDELVSRGHDCATSAENVLASHARGRRAAGPPVVVHVLACAHGARRVLAEAGLADAPAIVPSSEGWDLLPFGVAHDAQGESRVLARTRLLVPDGVARTFAAPEWESRYRAVASAAACDHVLDLWARECDRREGAVAPQGSASLLLGHQPAAIEFELGPLPPAAWRIEVHLELLAGEPDLALVGRIEIDGRECGRIGPTCSHGAARIEVCTVDLPSGSRPRRLCLWNGADLGGTGHLRVRRIRVSRPRVEPAGEDLRERLRSLRVHHGAALDADRLPRVGVVVVTLLGKPLVERCLAALESCDYPVEKFEVVVVDNDSRTDLGSFLARRHPRARLVTHPHNIGFTQGVSSGVSALESAEILVLLNDDVVVERDWLRELVSPIARGECAATGARMFLPSGEPEFDGGGATFQGFAIGTFADQLAPHPHDGDPAEHPRRALFACGGAMAISLEAWRAVGGLDGDYFAYYDDLDLGWRLWISGREVHYVPSAVCRHARSSTSRRLPRASVRRLQVRNALITCIKNYDEESFDRLWPALLALASRRSWVMARHAPLPDLELVGRRPRAAWIERLASRRTAAIGALAFADYAAVNEVLGAWDRWMARRAGVQIARQRGQAEILRLFIDPLRCVEGEAEYVALQRSLVDRLRLTELFSPPAESAHESVQHEHARGCLERVELRAGVLTCSGWLLVLDGPVDEVALLVDGRVLGTVRTVPRPDVTACHAGAHHSITPGFRLSVPADDRMGRAWQRLEVHARRDGRIVGVLETAWRADALEHYPDPPPHLMLRVAGGTAAAVFKFDGLRTASDLLRALGRHGSEASIADVLDFGAGCGRVTGFLPALRPTWRVSACDVDTEAVTWAREHHPRCLFEANPFDPPTPFAAAAFDLVLSYSVFTHLDAARQRAWLAELRRILRPGGLLVATVQGVHAARLLGLADVVARIDAHGIDDRIQDPALAAVLPPGTYRSTFQSEVWTRSAFGAEFEVLAYVRAGALGLQDVVVARARARSART